MRALAELAPAVDALAGRVILVVGAAGALGEEVARASAAAGATVVLLGRRVPKLNKVYDAIESAGGPQPALYPLDLEGAGPADYEQLADTIERECGRLDGIFHAAAEFKGLMSIETTPAEDWVRGMHVNVTAPLLLTRACLPLLRRASDAAIVVPVDDPQRVAKAYWGPYGVAQSARAAMVQLLGDECENSSIRVHGIQPGPMRTSLRAKAYFAEDPAQWPRAGVYAGACVWLLAHGSADARGQVLAVRA